MLYEKTGEGAEKISTPPTLLKVSGKPNRLDLYLTHLFPLSRSRIQKYIDDALIHVNGAPVKSSFKVKHGDEIKLLVIRSAPVELVAEEIALDIVYEDEALLIVNKPVGMVVHPATGNLSGTLANALLHHCQDLTVRGGRERPGLVHRLDKDTSGIMVIAKTDTAHELLSAQFAKHTIKRHYLAIAAGVIKEKEGKIVLPIGRDRSDRKKISNRTDRPKHAETHFTVAERFEIATLLDIQPQTGRTHQIRVHLAHLLHPVVGDKVYGGRTARLSELAAPRQMLHALSLGFIHPVSKQEVLFASPPPADMQEILEKLRGHGGQHKSRHPGLPLQ
ncbi:MAG: RluA family pseudouridine synthase [Nitrospirota bacterium]